MERPFVIVIVVVVVVVTGSLPSRDP